MLFYISYSCGCGDNEEIISANNFNEAEQYAYTRAVEEYESYEGLHGIRSMGDILEDEFGVFFGDDNADDFYEAAQDIYNEEVENIISYSVKPYNEKEYSWLLEFQNNKAYEI